MKNEQEPLFEELPAREDQQPSIYLERIKARTYSDHLPNGDYQFSDAELEEKGRYWTERMHSEETSRRAVIEIGHIIDSIALELYARRREQYSHIVPNGVPETLPADWQ